MGERHDGCNPEQGARTVRHGGAPRRNPYPGSGNAIRAIRSGQIALFAPGRTVSRFAIIVEFELLEGGFDLFLQEVLKNGEASKREEAGCQCFDVLVPSKEDNRIVLYEVYDDEAAFQAHLQSRHFKDFSNRVSGLVTDRKLTRFRLDNDG